MLHKASTMPTMHASDGDVRPRRVAENIRKKNNGR
jgi:hypothetical protein